MSQTTKRMSERDANQTLQLSYNDLDASITTNGFLVGKKGRKIEVAISTTNLSFPDDTVTYTFSEDGTTLYAYKIIYTNGGRTQMISAERVL